MELYIILSYLNYKLNKVETLVIITFDEDVCQFIHNDSYIVDSVFKM